MSRKAVTTGHHIELAEVRRLFLKELYSAGFFDAARYYEWSKFDNIAMIRNKTYQLRTWAEKQIRNAKYSASTVRAFHLANKL